MKYFGSAFYSWLEKENFRFFCKISEFGIWNNSETMVEKSEFEMFMNETKIIVNEQNKTNKWKN